MKKVLFLLLIPLLLCSCGESSANIYTPLLTTNEKYDSSKDYEDVSIGDYTIEISPKTCKNMIENKEDFCLWYHNFECGTCLSIKPTLIRYILETKKVIYSIDIGNDETFLDMQVHCRDLKDSNGNEIFFNDLGETSTPILFFFKDGAIVKKQLGQSNLTNYKFLSRLINTYLAPSKSKFIDSEEVLTQSKTDSVIFFYDNNHANEVSIYNYLMAYDIELYVYNTNIYLEESPNSSKIINYSQNIELTINDTTTIDQVLTFLSE